MLDRWRENYGASASIIIAKLIDFVVNGCLYAGQWSVAGQKNNLDKLLVFLDQQKMSSGNSV